MARPTQAEVDDRVEAWHAGFGSDAPLHEALGWTEDEYRAWVEDGRVVPDRPLPPCPAPKS